jgi:hypothetical protein
VNLVDLAELAVVVMGLHPPLIVVLLELLVLVAAEVVEEDILPANQALLVVQVL